jgi:hypothetical protein
MSPTIALEVIALLWNPKICEVSTAPSDHIIIRDQLSSSAAADGTPLAADDISMPPLNVVRASQLAWSTILNILSAITVVAEEPADEDAVKDAPASSSTTPADESDQAEDDEEDTTNPAGPARLAMSPFSDVIRITLADPSFNSLCRSIVQVDLSALTFT